MKPTVDDPARRFARKQAQRGREVFVPVAGGRGEILSSPARRFSSVADFRSWCQGLVLRDETAAALKKILDDPNHPHFMHALRLMIEQGFGRTPHVVELTAHRDGGPTDG